MERLIERTRTRLSVVVDTHKFLAAEGNKPTVNIRELLLFLSDRFNTIRNVGAGESLNRETVIDADSIAVSIDDAMILVMIVAEVMAVVDHREHPDAATPVTVTLRRSGENAHLVIAAREASGIPSETQTALDAMALLMIRQLVDSLNGTPLFRRTEGILFRLVFPVPREKREVGTSAPFA